MQSTRDYFLRVHGKAVVGVAKSLASQLGLTSQLVAALAYTGHPNLAGELLRRKLILASHALVKGLTIRFIEKDPCAAYAARGNPVSSVCCR
jgi:hypothetical protein